MTYKISFQELAEAQKVVLCRQRAVSLEQARKQVNELEKSSIATKIKGRPNH